MTESKKHSRLGNLLFGLFFIAGGIFPFLAAFDIGPLGRGDINGPWWLGAVAGGIFIAAGLAVIAGESAAVFRNLMALLVVAGLAALGNWIAFGVGERACTGDLSFPGFGGVDEYSGLACRIPFGIGALFIDAFLFYLFAAFLQKALGGPPRLARLMKVAEGLILVALSPLLLVLFLFLFGRVAYEAVGTRLKTGAWPRNEGFIRQQKAKGLLRRNRER